MIIDDVDEKEKMRSSCDHDDNHGNAYAENDDDNDGDDYCGGMIMTMMVRDRAVVSVFDF